MESPLLINGEITSRTSQEIVSELTSFRDTLAGNPGKSYRLILVIDSQGGSSFAAMSIIGAMDLLKSFENFEMRTVVAGTVASAAVAIFINGTHGSRIITPGSLIITHNVSYEFPAGRHTLDAIESTCDVLNAQREELVDVYARNLKDVSKEKIRDEYFSIDRPFNATQAKRLKFADHIKADYFG